MSFAKKIVSLFNEGLSNPQRAASGGLLHDAVVVAGVHRKCAVGIKDPHIEIVYAACRGYYQDCAFLRPSDVNCSMTELPTVSGAVRSRSPKWRDVSGFLHSHVENCRQSQALCTPPHENGGTSKAICTPRMSLPTVSGCLHILCTPLTKIAERLRRSAPPC